MRAQTQRAFIRGFADPATNRGKSNESAASRAYNDRAERRIIAARPQVLHVQVIPAARCRQAGAGCALIHRDISARRNWHARCSIEQTFR
jgi:hypothetical protein